MEAPHRHQLTLHQETLSGGQQPSGKARLIDPAAIDCGSARGLARLGLMLGPVLDRLTAAELPPGSEAWRAGLDPRGSD